MDSYKQVVGSRQIKHEDDEVQKETDGLFKYYCSFKTKKKGGCI